MILSQWQLVLDGIKTQTRRVVKPGEVWVGFYSDGEWAVSSEPPVKCLDCRTLTIHTVRTPAGKVKYRVGSDYAIVPKRSEAAVGRFSLLSIRIERLQEISQADAVAEGVQSIAAYHDLWESINGRSPAYRWSANPLVWVYTLKYSNMNYAPMLQAFKELE